MKAEPKITDDNKALAKHIFKKKMVIIEAFALLPGDYYHNQRGGASGFVVRVWTKIEWPDKNGRPLPVGIFAEIGQSGYSKRLLSSSGAMITRVE